jgi:hypothetical protein
MDYVLVSVAATIISVAAAAVCYFTDLPTDALLLISSVSCAVAMFGGLAWVAIRKK